jgi:hypothetical protein
MSLGRAAPYGAAAALAGCILGGGDPAEPGDRHRGIVVGVMVGKAVRAGSKGLGGRQQQILAVLAALFRDHRKLYAGVLSPALGEPANAGARQAKGG